ncbi:hypothetical protein GOP47_0015938 [Adiantum capillus-veneris]|uniref:Uncharacterized protein n=1 Tax=Adiantum capillus-veneris TaxID=13818 RepID=A0A9D4ZD28_ADICA|nr:hypothetical protein GOP47_0015938 [Adiantum capillus-veneris]
MGPALPLLREEFPCLLDSLDSLTLQEKHPKTHSLINDAAIPTRRSSAQQAISGAVPFPPPPGYSLAPCNQGNFQPPLHLQLPHGNANIMKSTHLNPTYAHSGTGISTYIVNGHASAVSGTDNAQFGMNEIRASTVCSESASGRGVNHLGTYSAPIAAHMNIDARVISSHSNNDLCWNSRNTSNIRINDVGIKANNELVQTDNISAHNVGFNTLHAGMHSKKPSLGLPPSLELSADFMKIATGVLHLLSCCHAPIPLEALPDQFHKAFHIPSESHQPNYAFANVLHWLQELFNIFSYNSIVYIMLSHYGYGCAANHLKGMNVSLQENLASARGDPQSTIQMGFSKGSLSHAVEEKPYLQGMSASFASRHDEVSLSRPNGTDSSCIPVAKFDESKDKFPSCHLGSTTSTLCNANHCAEEDIEAHERESSRFKIYMTFRRRSSFTRDDADKYFSTFGRVKKVEIPVGSKRDFGFVTFVEAEAVERVLRKGNPHLIAKDEILVKAFDTRPRKHAIGNPQPSNQKHDSNSHKLLLTRQFHHNDPRPSPTFEDATCPQRVNEEHEPVTTALSSRKRCNVCLCLEGTQESFYVSCKHAFCATCRAQVMWIPKYKCPLCFLWGIQT